MIPPHPRELWAPSQLRDDLGQVSVAEVDADHAPAFQGRQALGHGVSGPSRSICWRSERK